MRDIVAPMLILLIIGGFLAAFAFLFNSPNNNNSVETLNSNYLRVYEQNISSREVVVEEVRLSVPGFVVVRESSVGAPGDVVGVSDVLNIGTHERIKVQMDDINEASQVFFASLYRDNGNGSFSLGEDKPILKNGQAVYNKFTVERVESG